MSYETKTLINICCGIVFTAIFILGLTYLFKSYDCKGWVEWHNLKNHNYSMIMGQCTGENDDGVRLNVFRTFKPWR